MQHWTCALELDSSRQIIAGSEDALVDAIRRGADLRICTEFRHNEHIDVHSPSNEKVREVAEFAVTYLVEDRWTSGVMTLRQPVELPKDSLHHNTPIEWWYFNGHLTDSEENQFSYHFTVFQTEQDLDDSYPQLFHLSWHDHQTRNVYHSEKTFQQYGELPKDYINFRVAAWQMTETEEQFILYFDIPDSTCSGNTSPP